MTLIINNKSIEIIEANTFKKRFFGLMGKQNIKFGLLFKKCKAIHTFFMKEPIDIVGLNEQDEIIYIYQNLSPNKVIRIKHPLKKTSILELPKNTSSTLKLNQKLFFE